jgi:isopentenyldiphosphate isomerase
MDFFTETNGALLEMDRLNSGYSDEEEEWLPVVTADGRVTGKASRADVHSGMKLLHPVVHLHFIRQKSLLLQKRPFSKLVQPGKWDTAVGGHVSAGESVEDALIREAFEETGMENFSFHLLKSYCWDTETESELVYLFISDTPIIPGYHTEEVDELRYWDKSEIRRSLKKGILTPNLEFEFGLLCEWNLI